MNTEITNLFNKENHEPKIITMKLKDLLNELKLANTKESIDLLELTKNNYLNADYSKWDLDIVDNAYSEFINVLEDMEAELIYSKHLPLLDKEKNLRQEKELFTINIKIDTKWPKVLKGFSRKEGWKEVSVEDVLKYIASNGQLFVTPLGYVWKNGKIKEYRF